MQRLDVGVALAPEEDGDSWATPADLFSAYHWEFGFTMDAACRAHNAKLPGFRPADGLAESWGGERVWLNPPYSDIEPWIAKAAKREADLVALLLPVRVDTDWWRRYVQSPEGKLLCDGIRFFRSRVRFVGATGSPSWATALVLFHGPSASEAGGKQHG